MAFLVAAAIDLRRAKSALFRRICAAMKADIPPAACAGSVADEPDDAAEKWSRLHETEARVAAFTKEINAGLPKALHRGTK